MLTSLAALSLGCSLAPRQGIELTDVFLTDNPTRVHVQVDDFGPGRSDDTVLRRVIAEVDLLTGAILAEKRANRIAVRTVAEQLGEPSEQAKYRLMLARPKKDELSDAADSMAIEDSMAIVTTMAGKDSVPRMLSRTVLKGGAAADAKPAVWRDEAGTWFASESLNQFFVLYTSASQGASPHLQLAIGRLNARGRMDEAVYTPAPGVVIDGAKRPVVFEKSRIVALPLMCCVCRDYAYYAFGSKGLLAVPALSSIRGGVAVDTSSGNQPPGEGVGTAYRAEGKTLLANKLKDGDETLYPFSEEELELLFANAPSLPPAPEIASSQQSTELLSASTAYAAVGVGALLAVGAGVSLWQQLGKRFSRRASTLPTKPCATIGTESK